MGLDRTRPAVLRAYAGGAGAPVVETPAAPADAPSGRSGRGPAILCGVTNRAATALRLSAVAAATLLASGCAVFSPVQTDEPYIPAEGVPFNMPGLSLRNLAIVTGAAGGPGVVVGQVVNESSKAVDVSFGIQGGAQASTSTAVPANSGDTITDESRKVEIGSLPVPAGSMVNMTITTAEAGQNVVLVPVLLDNRFYEGLVGSSG